MKSNYLLFILFVINGYTSAQNYTTEIFDCFPESELLFSSAYHNFFKE